MRSKLEKYLPAVIVFASTFVATALLCQYSLIRLKDHSLFLFTRDYLSEALALKTPVFHIVKSFFLQFFDIKLLAPALIALLSTLLFAVVRIPLRKSTAAVYAVAVLISVSVFSVCMLPSVRTNEKIAKVQIHAKNYNWDRVLKVATPSLCAEDGSFRPYAALALASRGQLADNYRYYSIGRPSDIDQEASLSLDGLFFGSLLYDAFGSPNEAIHRTFQSAVHLDHGTSFETLCQLIRYNIETGNYTMVRKYATILGRSPRHYFLSKSLLRIYGQKEDRDEYRESAFITDNPVYNVAKLATESGQATVAAVEYFKTYSILNSVEQ